MDQSVLLRQILVYDKDRAFITLLQNALGEHGFEVQAEAPQIENIHMINVLKPEAIFIAVDADDKIGYTLCNKARKLAGKKTLIVVATSSLSPHDLALHRNLKLRADIYLDKRGLSRKELLHKLDKLLRIEIGKSPIPQEEDNGLPQPEDISQITDAGSKDGLIDETPELTHKAKDAGSNRGQLIPDIENQSDSINDQANNEDEKDDDRLQHVVAEQEREIFRLRKQLEEARREASSSPFSEYFLSMRDQIEQKELEIIQLKEKIDKSKKENQESKTELKKVRKEIANLKKEIGKGTKHDQELTALVEERQNAVEEAQKELIHEQKAHKETRERFESKITDLINKHDVAYKRAELRHAAQLAQLQSEKNEEIEDLKQKLSQEVEKAADMMIQVRKAHQEAPKQLEMQITQIQAIIEDMEKRYIAMLRIIEEKYKNDIVKHKEDFKNELESVEGKYTTQFTKFKSEKDAEINDLKQKASDEAKKAADILNQERKSYEETLKQYETKIGELEAAVKDAERQHLIQIRAAEEKGKTDLSQAENYHNSVVNSIVKKHSAELAQLRSEMAKERQTYQEARKEYETKITKLLDQHADAYKKAELKHAAQLAELQSEKDAEIEALKKKINEKEGEKVPDILNKGH